MSRLRSISKGVSCLEFWRHFDKVQEVDFHIISGWIGQKLDPQIMTILHGTWASWTNMLVQKTFVYTFIAWLLQLLNTYIHVFQILFHFAKYVAITKMIYCTCGVWDVYIDSLPAKKWLSCWESHQPTLVADVNRKHRGVTPVGVKLWGLVNQESNWSGKCSSVSPDIYIYISDVVSLVLKNAFFLKI